MFEAAADKHRAQTDAKARVFELTAIGLNQANLDVTPSEQPVRFDSEEECQRTHGGDWNKRLSQPPAAKRH
ncbi:hypothetical protein GCM10017655_34760 [Pseudomonas turukhanskensis]|uniref:Uncharacterized protein n=1 Tax=Pseudomonas turukhanskensis TaxID=1806536 RepID=A0A9W6KBB3_9PSED|nr:hypothetical protein GCM10017655_34760 [Pseudomonas turukhanskensis]